MNITDPDWRDDLKREKSYKWIGLAIIAVVIMFGMILGLANHFGCTPLDVIHKIFHHIFPHTPISPKDILPNS